jgi:hypothetical protein
MNTGKDWWVTLEHEDALLFAMASDGTVKMRVVPVTQWEAQLADMVRHLVSDDDTAGVPSAGIPSAVTK